MAIAQKRKSIADMRRDDRPSLVGSASDNRWLIYQCNLLERLCEDIEAIRLKSDSVSVPSWLKLRKP
jgi:hypothetical protein